MTETRRDPLLATARIMTIVMRAVLALGLAGMALAVVVLALAAAGAIPPGVSIEPFPEGSSLTYAIAAVFAAAVSLALMYDFVSRLAQIIASVGDGDPFIAENARRLARMGWLALATQATLLATTLFGQQAEGGFAPGTLHFDSEVSLSGLALAVLLFVLARVFREGTRLRDEVEGTV